MSNGNDPIEPSREALFRMAEDMARASDGQLRVARNESDRNTRADREAATFLKLRETRLGRDLEVYAFMAKVQEGWGPVLPDIAAETVLQLRECAPEAYAIGAAALVAMGRSTYPEASHDDWAEIFVVPGGPRP